MGPRRAAPTSPADAAPRLARSPPCQLSGELSTGRGRGVPARRGAGQIFVPRFVVWTEREVIRCADRYYKSRERTEREVKKTKWHYNQSTYEELDSAGRGQARKTLTIPQRIPPAHTCRARLRSALDPRSSLARSSLTDAQGSHACVSAGEPSQARFCSFPVATRLRKSPQHCLGRVFLTISSFQDRLSQTRLKCAPLFRTHSGRRTQPLRCCVRQTRPPAISSQRSSGRPICATTLLLNP